VIASSEKSPYGFWRLFWPKGATPTTFRTQQFTSFAEAHKGLKAWCNDNKIKIVLIDTGRKTAFEEGRTFEDVYNPPELKTKQKVKKVEETLSFDTRA
jgi:hypothetical protein